MTPTLLWPRRQMLGLRLLPAMLRRMVEKEEEDDDEDDEEEDIDDDEEEDEGDDEDDEDEDGDDDDGDEQEEDKAPVVHKAAPPPVKNLVVRRCSCTAACEGDPQEKAGVGRATGTHKGCGCGVCSLPRVRRAKVRTQDT